ncbi:DUF2156 domain-containing protein [Caldicellulosiruptor morganii]|uniref:Phosphatidylglycerol lysyltransferase domain-containing protein n=1 Tax=Caldicellulosiruptor morganii TaxID=1387555 RepID=A0ABY7BR26_9FIRM|nr:phosphatidylglycerol lysyltransferase domain-containing protein [Caldicellulosiruptor morganii]WAM34275.1 phosphatidylglycerol lysyltransferase domain-containing protein [Caldicellulosiruptor morganii]
MKFYKIDISHKRIFEEYFKAFQPEIADLTFTNLFMWDPFYDINFSEEDEFLLIMAKPYNQPPFLHGPVGNNIDKLPNVIEKAKRYFEDNGYKFMIKRASRKTIDMLTQCGMKFESVFERDLSDYVYRVDDLVQLRGKKYHAKKNHINKFLRLYGESYEWKRIDDEIVRLCWDFECEWYEKRNGKDDIGLTFEKLAIKKAIRFFDKLSYQGMVIFIDGKIKAFTFGEPLNQNTVVIHIEKADPDIEGLYTFINNKFLAEFWQDFEFVNREEDLGREGIRKAKMSYHPCRFAEKYTVLFD